MKAKISFDKIDKSAHTPEQEVITSIAGAVKCMDKGRMHVLMTGDDKRLSPEFHAVYDVIDVLKHSKFKLGTNYKQQQMFLFSVYWSVVVFPSVGNTIIFELTYTLQLSRVSTLMDQLSAIRRTRSHIKFHSVEVGITCMLH